MSLNLQIPIDSFLFLIIYLLNKLLIQPIQFSKSGFHLSHPHSAIQLVSLSSVFSANRQLDPETGPDSSSTSLTNLYNDIVFFPQETCNI